MKALFSLISYTQEDISFYTGSDLQRLFAEVNTDHHNWLTVNGFSANDRPIIEQIFSFFKIDFSLIDNVLDEKRLPMPVETKDHLFMDYEVSFMDPDYTDRIQLHGSCVLNHRNILLFDRDGSHYFDELFAKVLAGNTRAQEFGPDYLFYLQLRVMIANGKKLMLVNLVNQFEDVEDEVINNPGEEFVLDDILALRQRVRPLYASVLRLRNLIDYILEEESRFIAPHTRELFEKYLEKDSSQLWQGYSQLRDWTSVLMDIHRANVVEKTNRIIHILTVISFIFLPITFITSLYGMNFIYMPELTFRYGYFIVLGVIILVVTGLLLYMRRIRWI